MSAPVRHPAWCDPGRCLRTDERPGGVHQSAPVVVELHAAPFGVRVELSLIGSQHRDGRELTHVDFTVITDPIPGDEDVMVETFEMPIGTVAALALARELRRIVGVAAAAEAER